ncbi:hypothetical protein K1T71_000705 [Dendrolimus kikuchii]|uniref:Uncharacterized protein n=1 Tax=Dendrolimus kikuchii TaxID=765133 RepID=A0ACC1DL12_9NEOP|nr:hypothetical protein K1T71_000705 [Dendrolimus kikuchii]
MENYLRTTLNKLAMNNYAELTLVIGNESCDLDSVVSALTYAAYLNWQYTQIKCKVCTKANRDDLVYKDDIFIPILNVDRQDYDLKTEVVYALKEQGIGKEMLVFRDDQDLKSLIIKSKKTSIILVDHHVLSKNDSYMAPHVTEAIDHRPLDSKDWKYSPDCRRTIELVGSCCSLVAQRVRDLSALVAKEGDFFKEFMTCADLLHSTIILDTVNFSKEVNKATPRDEEVMLYLESLLKYKDCESERKRKLDSLVAARSDVSSLNTAQLLRKDVKILGDVLVPSFPILTKHFLERPNALQAVSEALTRTGCSMALLLGMDLSGGLKRDGAAVSPENPTKSTQIVNFLENWINPELGLEVETAVGSGCLYFTQKNLSASRKQYMPALQEFVQI